MVCSGQLNCGEGSGDSNELCKEQAGGMICQKGIQKFIIDL
jgi:hypothetical protein